MMAGLTKYEIETLEMLAGRREEKRGAMVLMCLDTLRRHGYCTPGPDGPVANSGVGRTMGCAGPSFTLC